MTSPKSSSLHRKFMAKFIKASRSEHDASRFFADTFQTLVTCFASYCIILIYLSLSGTRTTLNINHAFNLGFMFDPRTNPLLPTQAYPSGKNPSLLCTSMHVRRYIASRVWDQGVTASNIQGNISYPIGRPQWHFPVAPSRISYPSLDCLKAEVAGV